MRVIDLASWPRKQQFDFFRRMDWPYVSLCADVDVTALLTYCRENRLSDYRAIVFAILDVCQQLDWLRWRIRDELVVEHDTIDAGITALSQDQQLRLTRLTWAERWQTFDAVAAEKLKQASQSENLVSVGKDDDALVYLSCLPWVRFTQMTNPVPLNPPDSVPRIVWGKYEHQQGKSLMPLAIQVHHGLADGLHLAQLYQLLQERFDTPETFFGN